jgi:hypothetical protein
MVAANQHYLVHQKVEWDIVQFVDANIPAGTMITHADNFLTLAIMSTLCPQLSCPKENSLRESIEHFQFVVPQDV